MNVRILLPLLVSTVTVLAVEPSPEKPLTTEDRVRLEKVKTEVERRRIIREALAGEAKARQVINDHESGAKQASDKDLAAARATVRIVDEVRAASPKPDTIPNDDRITLKLAAADMRTVANAFKSLFGEEVGIADRAKTHQITLIVSTPTTRARVREKMIAALEAAGVYVVPGPNGTMLDTERRTPPSMPTVP